MATINMPVKREREKKESPLDLIMKGLDVAGSVYGLYTNSKNIENQAAANKRAEEAAAQNREEFSQKQLAYKEQQQGIIRPQEETKLMGAGWEKGTGEGAMPFKVRRTTDAGDQDTEVYLRPPRIITREAAVEAGVARNKADEEASARDFARKKELENIKNSNARERDAFRQKAAKKLQEIGKKQETGKLLQAESNAALFYTRALQAHEQIVSLAESGYDRASYSESAKAWLPTGLSSEEAKLQKQAELNFVTAILRPESGSAIGEKEYATAENIYFPRAGDGFKVIAQKTKARELAIEGLLRGSGKARQEIAPQGSGIKIPTANKSGTTKQTITPSDQAALDWLKANPKDPDANAVREKLKAKGIGW